VERDRKSERGGQSIPDDQNSKHKRAMAQSEGLLWCVHLKLVEDVDLRSAVGGLFVSMKVIGEV